MRRHLLALPSRIQYSSRGETLKRNLAFTIYRSRRIPTLLCPARFSSEGTPKHRPDPFARRPNKKCDPYGQGGKPLDQADASRLLATVHPDWILDPTEIPQSLTRRVFHDDFLQGAAFLQALAAVAQMNDHFPSFQLQRELDSKKKQWRIVSTITCRTHVLQGLSHHDFFLATLIDVEMDRPEISSLVSVSEQQIRN